jgi:hypothetical protein
VGSEECNDARGLASLCCRSEFPLLKHLTFSGGDTLSKPFAPQEAALVSAHCHDHHTAGTASQRLDAPPTDALTRPRSP